MTYRTSTEPVSIDHGPSAFQDDTVGTRVARTRLYERRGQREALKLIQSGGVTVVYAAWVPGNLVKIGCTTDLYARLQQFRGELIGFRFGDFDLEREIHRSLKPHVATGREWYYPTGPVIAFANELREGLGLEPIAA